MSPRYMEIKKALEEQIDRGLLPPGYRFPSEPEMAAKFRVSRETFRAAVKKLEEEGKIRVQHGVGTFVIRQLDHVPSNLNRLQSTSEMLRAAGLQESDRHQTVRHGECTEEWAAYLNLKAGDPVVILERGRMADGEPVMTSVYILPQSIAGRSFDSAALSGSLFQFLEHELGITIRKSHTEIKVPPASNPYVKSLTVHPETGVLLMQQTHYDENNFPVFYAYDYFRNDVFRFWIDRMR